MQAMDKLRNFKQLLKRNLLKLGKVLYTTFSEFCECSSVNGVRYITERRLHWSERIWWIITIGVSLWMCGSLIHDRWVGWRDNPTTMKDEKDSTISEIPFPTVTICPALKVTNEKFDLAAKIDDKSKISNLSDTDKFHLSTLAHICTQPYSLTEFPLENYIDESIYDRIEYLAPQLDYVLKECKWQTKPFNCSKYFVPVVLSEGLCFTFNALNSHDFYTNEMVSSLKIVRTNPNILNWKWDSGYKGDSVENEYPLRVDGSGPDAGLEISFVFHEQDRTSLCTDNDEEFEVFLSAPGEPMISKYLKEFDLKVPISTNSLLSMEPELTTTSQELRSYSPNERGCFHNSERRLSFHKFYSEKNCYQECAANYSIHQYGCVPFFSPRRENTKLSDIFQQISFYRYMRTLVPFFQSGRDLTSCNCLPSCKSLNYHPKLDSAKFNMSAVNEAKGYYANNSGIKMSKLAIFFKEQDVKRVQRTETSTYANFLSICGGLLGLFLDITAISIIEIVYYLSLRLFWNVRNLCARNSVAPIDLAIAGPSIDETQNATRQEEVKLSRAVKEVAIDFCNNGCIHGVQYITEKGLYRIKRFGWSIAIILFFGVCGYLMRNIWIDWNVNLVTLIREPDALVWKIPQPAVTYCPVTKTMKTKFDISSALKNSNNLSDIQQDQLKALAHVCPLLADLLQYTDEYMNESIYNIIENLSMTIYPFGWYSHRLVPVLTDEGLCLTYNNLNSREIYTDAMAPGMMIVTKNPNVLGWSLDSLNIHYGTMYPRIGDPGITQMYFKMNKNDNNGCKGIDEGIKVIVTVPGDSLKLSRDYYRVPHSKRTQLKISAKLTTTSEALRRYAPNQRQCYYSTERQLRFFKNYTENRCKEECLANFTKLECGCVKFSMPRDRETRICGRPNTMCYRLAEKKLRISGSAEYFRSECNCLPACTSIEYTATVQRNDIDEMAVRKQFNVSMNGIVTLLAYQVFEVQVVNRRDTYTWTDFLSLCGGFLGLFLGMSALSVIEVIYYSTLRLFWTFRRLKSEFKGNSPIVEVIGEETIPPTVQTNCDEIEISLD